MQINQRSYVTIKEIFLTTNLYPFLYHIIIIIIVIKKGTYLFRNM